MKFLWGCVMGMIVSSEAFAGCTVSTGPETGDMNQPRLNCEDIQSTFYQGDGSRVVWELQSCITCRNTKMELYTQSFNSGECGMLDYQDCRCLSSCTTTSWGATGTLGYERRKFCNQTTCDNVDQYRCAVGFYGQNVSATGGCSQCPPYTSGIFGTTSSAGSLVVGRCYLPDGTVFSDATGSGHYQGNCYYKN